MRSEPTEPEQRYASSMPAWLRRAVVILGALLLCSCRAAAQGATAHNATTLSPVAPCSWDSGACGESGACAGCPACEDATCCECQACGRLVGPWDEYLCDGGDDGPRAHVVTNGSLQGLEREDTVATYTDRHGDTFVAPSSRVCIYAPRFASVRQVVAPMGATQKLFVGQTGDVFALAHADREVPASIALQDSGPITRVGKLPPSLYRGREHAGATERLRGAQQTIGLVGPYANLLVLHTGRIDGVERPVIANHSLAAITWTGDQAVQVTIETRGASAVFSPKQPGLVYRLDEPDSPRLRLIKLASTDAAAAGEEVEFVLRYDNVGDTELRDLAITDNLTTRLAYVADSARSTRDADFSTADNEAGSLVLRWELRSPLAPGEGGVLSFRARVQ